MTDTPAGPVKLPTGQRRWIILGSAAVVGWFGWRWWQGRQSAGAPATADVGETLTPSGVVGAPVSGNVQYAGTSQGTSGAPANNAEWTAGAVQKLSDGGWSAMAVYAALGDFLARQPLTAAEQQIVRAAIAAVGNPPQGGPYSVIEQVGSKPGEGTTSTTKPADVVGFYLKSRTTTSLTFAWPAAAGATRYHVYNVAGVKRIATVTGTSYTISGLKPGTSINVFVRAVGPAGTESGGSNHVTATTLTSKK